MIIYLSGAMASCPKTYKGIFAEAQALLEAEGHTVINPATLPQWLAGNKYMPICMAMIEAADAIYLFNDWEHSPGALLEKAYAVYQSKAILYG